MKATLIWSVLALAVSVHAYCDGTPDGTWVRMDSCDADDPRGACDERCRAAGQGCGSCGGFLYGECWCYSNDCS
jgi:hypothetical protein